MVFTTYMFRLHNSLTKQKDLLNARKDKPLGVYICGPTVYDASHLGHAKTYISFDIVRRVLERFGYSVFYVMNITDIDDKILTKVKAKVGSVNMDTVTHFARQMEADFWSDMDALNVERPSVVTRVTEYVDKMKEYVEMIEKNGLAYESNGSVYFDSEEFKRRGSDAGPLKKGGGGHDGHDGHGEEDEEDFSANVYVGEKKSRRDFALWKKSEDGEIGFPFKGGHGRPGWHLECSVMATDVLGDKFHVHMGGVDLCFPHHNNEIVQAQAYQNVDGEFEWAKFFLHSGHLNIEGLKMSKSLKNFITIKEFMRGMGTARQLRLIFLLHKWEKTLDYTRGVLEEAVVTEKRLVDFVKHVVFVRKEAKEKVGCSEEDRLYFEYVAWVREAVDGLLLDNVNTCDVMKLLLEGINKTYVYLEKEYNIRFVEGFKNFLVEMLEVFGISFEDVSGVSGGAGDYEKFVDLAVNMREDVRSIVTKYKKEMNKDMLKDIFGMLDDFRDKKLKELGIQLEDREKGKITKWSKM